MVRDHMAWAFLRYSRPYIDDEPIARAANIDVHAHGLRAALGVRRF
jgi:hypothetical protein